MGGIPKAASEGWGMTGWFNPGVNAAGGLSAGGSGLPKAALDWGMLGAVPPGVDAAGSLRAGGSGIPKAALESGGMLGAVPPGVSAGGGEGVEVFLILIAPALPSYAQKELDVS